MVTSLLNQQINKSAKLTFRTGGDAFSMLAADMVIRRRPPSSAFYGPLTVMESGKHLTVSDASVVRQTSSE
jgi:hypothetical protein